MRRGPWHQVDEASLQTDVMRFMAIVAFCLIAILAMVRNVAPMPTKPLEPPKPPMTAEQPPVVHPVANTLPEEPDVLESRQTTAQISQPIPPQAPVTEQPSTAKPFHTRSPVVTIAKSDEIKDPITDTIPPSHETQAAEEEGLTLRFSSQSDFLRLVSRGKVAVYAFDQTTFLALGSDYRFQQVSPPRQVYELEATTIPAHMSAALPKDSPQTQFKWAVGLPQRVERQIQDYVATVESGELLINKFEEVRHVPAG